MLRLLCRLLLGPEDGGFRNGANFNAQLVANASHQRVIDDAHMANARVDGLEARVARLEGSWFVKFAVWVGTGWRGFAMIGAGFLALFAVEGLVHHFLDMEHISHPDWLP